MAVELDIVNSLECMIFGNSRATDSRLEKIRQQDALLLVAYDGDTQVGFKLGYVVKGTDSFFSWLGGVHKNYRRQGIAQALLDFQEDHVKSMGISTIYFTSYDRFPEMIQLGLKNKYTQVKSELDGNEIKYWFEKQLL